MVSGIEKDILAGLFEGEAIGCIPGLFYIPINEQEPKVLVHEHVEIQVPPTEDEKEKFDQLVADGRFLIKDGKVYVTVRRLSDEALFCVGRINPISGLDEFRVGVRAGLPLLWIVREIAAGRYTSGSSKQ